MKFDTKYNLGDKVYPITQGSYGKFKPCKTCSGTGRITVEKTGEDFRCPKCFGDKGKQEWHENLWEVKKYSGEIGKIDIELYDKQYKDQKAKISYMLNITGVGTGSVWKEESLFLTMDEAQKACDELNNKEDGHE